MTALALAPRALVVSFAIGFLLVASAWGLLGRTKRSEQWLALLLASQGTWSALRDLPHVLWVLGGLAAISLAARPHPHRGVARFGVAVMTGMLLAGCVFALG